MTPFFRKIRQHLLSEGKTGKYLKYAIGEVILVVIGILIALGINNWNENRKKIEKEHYYLNSIKTSIQLSQNELNRVIGDAQTISSSADTLFMLLAHKNYSQFKGITLDSLLWTASDYSLISLNDGGIQEILNTGSLDIIRNEDIRVILASWNERNHKIRKFEGETEYLSHKYQDYLMDFMDARRLESDSLVSMVIPEKKDMLLQDPMLPNFLNNIHYTHRKMHELYTEEKLFLDSLNNLITGYLLKAY